MWPALSTILKHIEPRIPASGGLTAPLLHNGASSSIALFESADGLQWKTTEQPKVLESKSKWADSTLSNFNVERPALLLDDGIPVPLFGATDGYKKERLNFVQRPYTTKTIHPRIETPMNFPMLIVLGLHLFGAALAGSEPPIIGAIRWDAWYGEKGPVKEVERSLGPMKYHFRLPFFARVRDQNTVAINGDSPAIMGQEIAFATQAGLAFWAFVDYGDHGELTMARKRYEAEPNKRGLRFCFVEEGRRLDALGTNAWPRLVGFFQSPDYQRVLEGRPLLFVFGAPKRMGKPHFHQLTEACLAAGLKRPYLVFMGWHPEQDAKIIQSLGFDAWSAYAAGGQYSGAMLSYEKLTAKVRNQYWEACRRLRLPTITFATTGWDTRPRLEHPVSWMPLRAAKPEPIPPTQPSRLPDAVTATPEQLASHVRDARVWTQTNRDLNPANAILLYAWNENDEGGWLIPTLNSDGSTNVNRISALNKMLSVQAEAPIIQAASPTPANHHEVLLFTYFRNNGTDGVHLATSTDRVNFTALNNDKPIFTPPPWPGQNLTRDASVLYHDGKFHMVWTTHWKGRIFGYAESKDLVHWSEPRQVKPFPESLPAEDQPDNIWAPEIHWDPLKQDYFILFASTTPRERNDDDNSNNNGKKGSQYDNRMYITRTRDCRTYSEAKLFFDRNFASIDAVMRRDESNRRWVMVIKCSRDETLPTMPGRNLWLTFTDLDLDHLNFSPLEGPIAGNHSPMFSNPEPRKSMAEGPSLLWVEGRWLLAWDEPAGGGMQLATSPDLKSWKHIKEAKFPHPAQHGTLFLAPRAAVGWLPPLLPKP